jgi:predicted Rossmann fold nucleotide-binding protein DprA/Smf involved in DNA uptake
VREETDRKAEINAVLKRLRAERAAHLSSVQAKIKPTTALRNKINRALKQGPQTVPTIAETIGETTDRVLWMLMEMRVYGMIEEDEQEGDYFKYRLIQEKKGT